MTAQIAVYSNILSKSISQKTEPFIATFREYSPIYHHIRGFTNTPPCCNFEMINKLKKEETSVILFPAQKR